MKERQITLNDIKDQFIMERLRELPYNFRVFVSTGAYQAPTSYNNFRKGKINTLIESTDSDISLLGGGIRAVAMNISMRFLLPVDDTTLDGDYSFVDSFREDLSNAFAQSNRIELTLDDGEKDKHYIGAVSVSFPIGGELLQRQGIGKSFEYTCYLQVAFLENAINSQDIQFYLGWDEHSIPYTTFSISRKNTLSANLYSTSTNGLSQVFAENSTYGIDLAMPAISSSASVTGAIINEYILCDKETSANKPYKLRIKHNGKDSTMDVIFGEVVENGAGAENVSWQVSFVPYIEAEDD